MAKIFDKIASRFNEIRLIRARQAREWTDTELKELPAMAERRTASRLSRKQKSLNRRLKPAAFKACDKAEYIDSMLAEKLRRYDVRKFMSYRAAYHSAAKAIFKAKKNGENYDAALEALAQKTAALDEKRVEYVKKLEETRARFLAENPSSDDAEYNELRSACEKEFDEYKAELEKTTAEKTARRTDRLQQKKHKREAKEQELKAKIKSDVEMPEDVLLRVENLKMYFGGLKAVDDLTFDVKSGEIFGLIGPNGAGKTTVFNCITRFYNATGGNMYFRNKDGEPVDLRRFKVHDVILEGISRTFQNVELVREISVLENLLVACTRNYRSGFFVQALGIPTVKREDDILKSKAMGILKFMGLESYAAWPAMGLPYGVLKKVEIARALMASPKLIVLDEPAAGLNNTETAALADTIVKIRDEFGCAVFLVEHDMSLVMSICDRILAISFGKELAQGTPAEIQKNKAVQEAYLGVSEETEEENVEEKPLAESGNQKAENAENADAKAEKSESETTQAAEQEQPKEREGTQETESATPKAKPAASKTRSSAKPKSAQTSKPKTATGSTRGKKTGDASVKAQAKDGEGK